VQTIGRAARNANGRVILYGDKVTDSMKKAMSETARRRGIQEAYNKKHGITPTTIIKKVHGDLTEMYGFQLTNDGEVEKLVEVKEAEKKWIGNRKGLMNEINRLRDQMRKHAKALKFEEAAKVRDDVRRLELLDLSFSNGEVDKVNSKILSGEEN
jgi:excinuclease ABC subunit B